MSQRVTLFVGAFACILIGLQGCRRAPAPAETCGEREDRYSNHKHRLLRGTARQILRHVPAKGGKYSYEALVSTDILYQYVETSDAPNGRLSLTCGNESSGIGRFRWRPEVGQEFVRTVYAKWFGHDVGELVCVEMGYGAGSQKLIVFGIGQDGRFQKFFERVARFGFKLVDVTDDGVDDICACDGDLYSKKTVSVYSLTDGAFRLGEVRDVRTPHRYAIVTQ